MAISQPIQHQSDFMNLDDTIGNTMGKVPSTPYRPTPITPPAISLSRNTQDKKRKQEHLADNFTNSNFILTGYCPQQEEQAQLLDLIVYDIPAKWDSYTLLGNLSFWGKIISISTKVHKKYLSARVRLIPNYAYLKVYNGGEWIVRLRGIPIRWFPVS
ncbi:hypothetical protein GLOIN_2v1773465 [Rhizophagus clarus]|uniref:Uncharacterized protein n=1 Tax=Rhizophagus clarus TaxID=94130 RepID=A0A8H3M6E9_9GLOM|nr:hypothetical protein GLOIN_2v1773465 [Rhizophagus clarus]